MKTLLIMVLFSQFVMAGGIDEINVNKYRNRYELAHVLQKKVDNRGNGYEGLYGARNFRMVLLGSLYRGGANNMYHNTNPRDNSNPLPEDGLQNLCEQGFRTAIYLYSTNFNTASKTKSCTTARGTSNTLQYLQIDPFKDEGLLEILKIVHREVAVDYKGPIYSHCWNGWHASGLVAATSLRQFCDLSADEAVRYWDLATDGVNKEPAYEKVRNRIRNFKPVSELMLSPEVQAKVCPSIEELGLGTGVLRAEKVKESRTASELMGVKL